MKRHAVAAPPFIDVRTGMKDGSERLGLPDAPGEPKTKTTAVVPEGMLSGVEISQLPALALDIGRAICAKDGCVMRSGIEQVDGVTELWTSCTGRCVTAGDNIPEQAIIQTGLAMAEGNSPR